MRRVIGWGGGAVAALVTVAFVTQTQTASARLEKAFLGLAEPTPALGPAPKPVRPVVAVTPQAAEITGETKRLAAQVRDLTADRDKLIARIASLEHRLEDVTGSIARPPVSTAAPAPATQSVSTAPAMISVAMPPQVAAVMPPSIEAPRIIKPLAMFAEQDISIHWSKPPDSRPAARRAAAVPLPRVRPIRMASATVREVPTPVRIAPEFAIDIGGSLSPNSLSGQWMTAKANFGPMFAGLHPVIGRDRHFGHLPYRLLIGPIPSVADAERFCARLGPAGVECRPALFEGQQLAQY